MYHEMFLKLKNSKFLKVYTKMKPFRESIRCQTKFLFQL